MKEELTDWNEVVNACLALGFEKITIIDRKTYRTLCCTAIPDIAIAWLDGDTQINENQELLDVANKKKGVKNDDQFIGKKYTENQVDLSDEMRFYAQIYKIQTLRTSFTQNKNEYRKISKYWCLLYQNDRNKMESFPSFIVDIICEYAIYELEIECLIGVRLADSYSNEYLSVKTFENVWFITMFHTKRWHCFQSRMKSMKDDREREFENYQDALKQIHENVWQKMKI